MSNPELETEWIVPAELPALRGHFPGHPVLPAYAILDYSLACVTRAFHEPAGGTAWLGAIDSAKFTQPLAPNDAVRIRIAKLPDGTWEVSWLRDGVSVAEIRLRMNG